tara:strand:+ start:1216 stop:2133 length:918 start_codon:yes stop_codon:yes gene_type:complete
MNLDEIFSSKPITESSKKLYIRNLTRLNGGNPIKNLTFLSDVTGVIDGLNTKYKPNTVRSYVISIVSLLKSINDKKSQKLYSGYYPVLEQLNKELKTNTTKSEKEVDNWISQADVKCKFDSLCPIVNEVVDKKKITAVQWSELFDCLVVGLYVLQSPRRNADYQKMLVLKKNQPALLEKFNILDLEKNKFLFSNYKTAGTYKVQEVDIDSELRKIIDVYLKFHPLKKDLKNGFPLLVNFTGQSYSNSNDMTRILHRIFNKKIGSSMLRKIFLTDKYKDTLDDLNDDAAKMGSSSETFQNQYIKTD